MHIPKRPPPVSRLMAEMIDGDRVSMVMAGAKVVDGEGRYLHWDTLRFRQPPEGLSVEEWWLATRLARQFAAQKLPLKSASGGVLTYCEPPPVRAALRYLDMNAGGALGSDAKALSQGEGRAHLARSLAEEPFASSFIEGAATTRQIAKKLILEGRRPRTRDELMVLNNYQALQFIKARRDTPLSMPILLELHRIITDGTLDDPTQAGRIRRTDDVQVVDDSTGEILHQPPLAAELDDRLSALIAFANAEDGADEWLHPLLRAVLLHFMLAYEHPFVDGNGRVARALFYWSALRSGYWLLEYISISSVIAEAKIQYGQAFLETETDDMDVTYFVAHQVDTLCVALKRFGAYMERKRDEVRVLETLLQKRLGPGGFNHRQAWLVNEFIRGRLHRITISDHEKQHKVSYLTARSDLERLADRGYLQKTKSAQTSIYRPVNRLTDKLKEA